MLRVSDVMTHSVVTLVPEMTLAEAAATLSTIGVSGAPVCDREGGGKIQVPGLRDGV